MEIKYLFARSPNSILIKHSWRVEDRVTGVRNLGVSQGMGKSGRYGFLFDTTHYLGNDYGKK